MASQLQDRVAGFLSGLSSRWLFRRPPEQPVNPEAYAEIVRQYERVLRKSKEFHELADAHAKLVERYGQSGFQVAAADYLASADMIESQRSFLVDSRGRAKPGCLAEDLKLLGHALLAPAVILLALLPFYQTVLAGWPIFAILGISVYAGTVAVLASRQQRRSR